MSLPEVQRRLLVSEAVKLEKQDVEVDLVLRWAGWADPLER